MQLTIDLQSMSAASVGYEDLMDAHESVEEYYEILETPSAISKFFKALGIPKPSKVEMIEQADDSDSNGYSFALKDGSYVYILDQHYASGIMRRLGTTAKFVVYKDTREQDGPFLGDPDPVKGTIKKFNSSDGADAVKYAMTLCK